MNRICWKLRFDYLFPRLVSTCIVHVLPRSSVMCIGPFVVWFRGGDVLIALRMASRRRRGRRRPALHWGLARVRHSRPRPQLHDACIAGPCTCHQESHDTFSTPPGQTSRNPRKSPETGRWHRGCNPTWREPVGRTGNRIRGEGRSGVREEEGVQGQSGVPERQAGSHHPVQGMSSSQGSIGRTGGTQGKRRGAKGADEKEG
jgi:hypothetical protein